MKKVTLVIPCYNEETNVNNFYNHVLENIDKNEYKYELVFVNDGSKDKTLEELKKIKNVKNVDVKILSFSRNFGKEAAMYAGLVEATGDYITIIDADLQQPVTLVISALNFLEENEDFDSVAFYQKNRKEGFILNFFKKTFYNLINKISDVEFIEGASDFRVMRKNVVESIKTISEKNRFSKGIFSWVGFNTHYEYYKPLNRASGETKWSFWKLFNYAISGIVSFTTVPLRFATISGVFVSLMSFIYMIVVIAQKIIFDITVPGYATIVVIMLFTGGVQLLSLGIVGEYLSKTYIETKNRPVYILKEKITNGEKNES